MAGIFGLKQSDLALRFLFRNLAEHILGEVMLKLPEGGHPIIDAIEQNENAEAGRSATAKSDKQALDQARAD